MKKLSTIFMAILALLFVSCKKDRAKKPTVAVVTPSAVSITVGPTGVGRIPATSFPTTSLKFGFVITVKNTSGHTLYLGQTVRLGRLATGKNAFAYEYNSSNTVPFSNPITVDTACTSSFIFGTYDAVVENNAYRIDSAATKQFRLELTLTHPLFPGTNYRSVLKQIKTFTDNGLTQGAQLTNIVQHDGNSPWTPDMRIDN